MAAPIGTLGNVPTMTVGGVTFVNIISSPVIALYGNLGGSTNDASGLIKMGSGTSTAYQVTGGMTLRLRVLRFLSTVAVTESLRGGMSDNAIALATTTAPTNPVYWGEEGAVGSFTLASVPASIGGEITVAGDFRVAATKYGFIESAATATSNVRVYAYGYEA